MALVPLIIFDPSFWAEDVHKRCAVKRLTLMDQEPGFNHLAEPLQARRTEERKCHSGGRKIL